MGWAMVTPFASLWKCYRRLYVVLDTCKYCLYLQNCIVLHNSLINHFLTYTFVPSLANILFLIIVLILAQVKDIRLPVRVWDVVCTTSSSHCDFPHVVWASKILITWISCKIYARMKIIQRIGSYARIKETLWIMKRIPNDICWNCVNLLWTNWM